MDVDPELQELLDALRAMDWRQLEELIEEVLAASGLFTSVERSVLVEGQHDDRRREIDFIAQEPDSPASRLPTRWAFEVKSSKRLVGSDLVDQMVGQFQWLQRAAGVSRMVVIAPGGFTRSAAARAEDGAIELWDGPALAAMIPADLAAQIVSPIGQESKSRKRTARPTPSEAETLLRRLADIDPGRPDWVAFQDWCASALKFLFAPPLEPPELEVADLAKRNRRDIVMENFAVDGFWAHMRQVYDAHYVVADAKNYSSALRKKPVLDIAHYLKPYGLGSFAILVCRKGAGPACEHAIREQWIAARKMIIVLSDEDMTAMIDLKSRGMMPEDLLRSKIREFRLSL